MPLEPFRVAVHSIAPRSDSNFRRNLVYAIYDQLAA